MWITQTLFLLHMISIPLEESVQIFPPRQAAFGHGGANYIYDEVTVYDHSQRADGYWLFVPAAPTSTKTNVIFFNHGYGAYNPMIYGAWIKHLVRKGNIVIYPRYQKNLFWPWPVAFAKNAAKGIRNALDFLNKHPELPQAELDQVLMIGHSYGAVVSADLAIHNQKYGLPKIGALLLCSPGTGPFSGGRLDDYSGMPADLKLLMVVNENDNIVSQDFQFHIFETASKVRQKNLLLQRPDFYGSIPVTATHSECYAIDLDFDSGHRTPSAYRALGMGQPDVVDFNVYWRLADGLLSDLQRPDSSSAVFGGSAAQRSLGRWSDSTPIVPLELLKD
jgi:pimeloyl-ACP methyl ester carboxylesterase